MTCVLLWFDTFTVHRHKRSADLSEVKRIPRRVISEYLQLFCGGRCRMIETASIFRARNQRGEKRNRESMSGNQTHQWKEHFRHGGPYLSPPDRQKTTSTCSTFNRHPSWLPKVPIWLVMDQTGLNVGPPSLRLKLSCHFTRTTVCFLAVASHSGSGGSWKNDKTLCARFKMVSSTRHSAHSRWNRLHQVHYWDWSYRSGCRHRPESQNMPSEIRFNPDYMAPVTSLYPNGKRPFDLHS